MIFFCCWLCWCFSRSWRKEEGVTIKIPFSKGSNPKKSCRDQHGLGVKSQVSAVTGRRESQGSLRKGRNGERVLKKTNFSLWGDPTTLSPSAARAASQNSGTGMLFALGEAIDEGIRYLPGALPFSCSQCTKPHFPSPIVFEQQGTRLFHSQFQNFSQLAPFLTLFPMDAFGSGLSVASLPLGLLPL